MEELCKLFVSYKIFNLKLYIWAWKMLSRKIQRGNISGFAGHTVYAMLKQNQPYVNSVTVQYNFICGH